jgi:GR25 family glycosyltransferase involved in LPS biosynthesis/predicted O-methyltransferase YrrM
MIEHFHWNITSGWFSTEQQELYRTMISSLPSDSHVVEIGCWKGKSTSFMAVEIANSEKSIQFDAVDTWEGSPEHQSDPSVVAGTLLQEFTKNIAPVKKYVNTRIGKSVDVAKTYHDESLDFIFIDGDHSVDAVKADIASWLPKLKPGGWIAGDDFNHWDKSNGVIEAVISTLPNVKINQTLWMYQKPPYFKFGLQYEWDKHLDMMWNRGRDIPKAWIISIKGNSISESKSAAALESCKQVGQPAEIFHGFDGTDKRIIKTPDHLKHQDWIKWLKLSDHGMSITEVSCLMSHMTLWVKSMTDNLPIIVLEHDAIMIKKFTKMMYTNTIEYLGHQYQLEAERYKNSANNAKDKPLEYSYDANRPLIPKHPANWNYTFPLGMHAYAIDPQMARRLFTEVITYGITNPTDTMCDLARFTAVQNEIYAVQNPEWALNSTIDIDPGIIVFAGRKHWLTIPGLSK